MSNYYDFDDNPPRRGFGSGIPGPLRAALIVSVGLLILNGVTFLTAGTGAALSIPLLGLVYLGCGILAAKLDGEASVSRAPVTAGAMGGAALWVISFLTNLLLTLLLGAPSLGISLLVGIPYLCLCSPVELLLGGILGSFGGLIYGLFSRRRDPTSSDGW